MVASPYDYTQQAASACFVTDPMVRTNSLADGGEQYWYEHSNGHLSAIVVPPAGFDPVNASESELAEYGLPARPSSSSDLAEWRTEMTRAWWAPPPSFAAELPATLAQDGPPTVPLAGSLVTFAGYQRTIPANIGSSASVTYREAGFSTPCKPYGIGTWAGLQADASAGGTFGQDGTLSFSRGSYHDGFWQVWSGGLIEGTNEYLQYIRAGDTVRANVDYPGNGFTGTVTNVTSGQVTGWSLPDFGGAPTAGEAIVEHLSGDNLPKFGTVNFSASSVNGIALNSSDYKVPTLDGSMSTGGIGGSGSFSVSYIHC